MRLPGDQLRSVVIPIINKYLKCICGHGRQTQSLLLLVGRYGSMSFLLCFACRVLGPFLPLVLHGIFAGPFSGLFVILGAIGSKELPPRLLVCWWSRSSSSIILGRHVAFWMFE